MIRSGAAPLGAKFDSLEDSLTGFSGFEPAMVVDVAVDKLMSSTAALVENASFKKDFDALNVKLNSSTCSKVGSCTTELKSLRALVAKYAGTSAEDRAALEKVIPNGSLNEFTSVSLGFLSVELKSDRSAFFTRVGGVRHYAMKVRSGYTEKSRTAFLTDALARIDVALGVLVDINTLLLREFDLRDGDVANCGRANPDVVHLGVPGNYRTLTMTWAQNGLPSSQKMEGGGSVDYTYSHNGRGFLAAVRESGMSSLEVESVLGAVPCGAPTKPSSWLRSGKCSTVGSLGLTSEMSSVVAQADLLSSETLLSRNALGVVTATTANGGTTSRTVDTWGVILREVSPAGRVTVYEPADGSFGAVKRLSADGRQAKTFYVRDGDGRVIQECSEIVAGSCEPYRNPAYGLDFSMSSSCLDVANLYRTIDVLEDASFKLKITKRTLEGKPTCEADEVGRIVESSYDRLGRLVSTLDWNSHDRPRSEAVETRYSYDINDIVTKRVVESFDGTDSEYVLEEDFALDGLGRVVAQRDPRGQISTFRYDAVGRVVDEQIYASDGATGEPETEPVTALLNRRRSKFDTHGNQIYLNINDEYIEERSYSRWGTAVYRKRTGFEPDTALLDGHGNLLWRRDSGGGEELNALDPARRTMLSVRVEQSSISPDFVSQFEVVEVDGDALPKRVTGSSRAADGVLRDRTAKFIYDDFGDVVSSLSVDGRMTTYANNLAGWPITVESERAPGGAVDIVDYSYAANGEKTSVIDPAGDTTVYGLDGDGRVAHADYPNGERKTTEFDGLGQPLVTLTTSGALIENHYARDGRLASRSVNGELYESFKYDALSRIENAKRMSKVAGRLYTATEEYRYDGLGRVSYESASIGNSSIIEVFASNTLSGGLWNRSVDVSMKGMYSRSNSYVQQFDGAGRLRQVNGSGWSRKFDFMGAVTASHHAEGSRAFEFASPRDGFMNTTQMVAQSDSQRDARQLLRDAMGQIIVDQRTVTNEPTRVRGYAYGDNLQLESVYEQSAVISANFAPITTWDARNKILDYVGGAQKTKWLRDELGSPLQRLTGANVVAEKWERTAGGNLTRHNEQVVTHDDDKRVKHDGELDFTFDDVGTLLEVGAAGDVGEGYITGPSGRLLAVVRANETEVFAWDGWDMIGSFSTTGVRKWRAAWGEMNELLRFENGSNQAMVPVLDSRHSVVGGWSKTGQWLGSVDYDESGRRVASARCTTTGPCQLLSGLPFTYAGGWSSNKGPVYFRHRWFSPKLGQFLSADPLEYRDSYNRFAYAAFDPVNLVDPWGLGAGPPEQSMGDWDDDRDGDFGGDGGSMPPSAPGVSCGEGGCYQEMDQDQKEIDYEQAQASIQVVPITVQMWPYFGTSQSMKEDAKRASTAAAFDEYVDAAKYSGFHDG
jgi:RHS repeat-associated protein